MPSNTPKLNYNLAVIGGGITGVAIAVDAALRGLSVLLLEKETLGHGTSSKTSKLAHGGLRYLENYEFRLVKEALRERNLLLKNAPHYVHPLRFIIPIYPHSPWSSLLLKAGLICYDFLAGKKDLPAHTSLHASDILSAIPGLNPEGLQKGFSYYDAQMDDWGLVQSLGTLAKSLGVTILEHTQAQLSYNEAHQVIGVNEFKTERVIQATGPWTHELLIQDNPQAPLSVFPSKGVHIVLPSLEISDALLLSTPQDNRVFFVIPWKGHTLVGTTDTAYTGNPDTVCITQEDRHYLLKAYNHYFPAHTQQESSILDSFVGLRPLFNFNQHGSSPSEKSRDFRILESSSGLFTLVGGKFTTHRAMAEAAVDRVCEKLTHTPWKACQTKEIHYDL